jgi:hypothetical protein
MLGPIPQDKLTIISGTITRTWKVWLQNLQNLVDFGETPSGETEIIGANGLSFGGHYQILRIISSTAGNTTVTKNPQIAPGFDGQVGIIEGLDNTRTVTISNGNGIVLKGASPFVIANNDVIQLHYNKGKDLWIEDYRNT